MANEQLFEQRCSCCGAGAGGLGAIKAFRECIRMVAGYSREESDSIIGSMIVQTIRFERERLVEPA